MTSWTSTDPMTGTVLWQGSDADVDAAVAAARAAQGPWALRPLGERIAIVERYADVVKGPCRGLRGADRARNRQAAVGSAHRSGHGGGQGGHFDHRAKPSARANALARRRGSAGAAPQAAWRAGGAGALQLPGAPAQRPYRAGAAGGQCGGVPAFGTDPGLGRVHG